MATKPQFPVSFELEQPKAVKKGLFSTLWLIKKVAKDEDNLRYVAKVEEGTSKHQLLKNEYDLYQSSLGKYRGIARVFQYLPKTPTNPYNVMIMERLGHDLESVFESNRKSFSSKTIIQLAMQMFNLVEYVHSQKIVHGAIQPDNFCLANPSQPVSIGYNDGYGHYLLYLIDFSLSTKYIIPGSDKHVPQGNLKLISAPRYISINVHNKKKPTRRDDLESLGYCWAYFVAGPKGLPWQDMDKSKIHATMEAISVENTDDKNKVTSDPIERDKKLRAKAIEKLVKQKKETTTISTMFQDVHEFESYMSYVKILAYDEKPNYDFIRKTLTDLYEKYKCDNVYDFQLNQLL